MSKDNVTPTEEKTAPTREEILKFFQEQIEVKKVQVELQDLNTRLAVSRAEELKALTFIAQITNPKPDPDPYQGGTPHKITQEDLDNNPELAEMGLTVGEEVIIPNEQEQKKERTLKK